MSPSRTRFSSRARAAAREARRRQLGSAIKSLIAMGDLSAPGRRDRAVGSRVRTDTIDVDLGALPEAVHEIDAPAKREALSWGAALAPQQPHSIETRRGDVRAGLLVRGALLATIRPGGGTRKCAPALIAFWRSRRRRDATLLSRSATRETGVRANRELMRLN